MNGTNPEVFQQFTIQLTVNIRLCIPDDLPGLEWFGLFTEHREIILDAYERQERGENLMLIAEANCCPAGQVWVDLVKKHAESTGVLWAVRVVPWLQDLGIGNRLMAVAEQMLRGRGFAYAELGVEKSNPAARRFYERLGYRLIDTMMEDYSYTTPEGQRRRIRSEEWVLRKKINGNGNHGAKESGRAPARKAE